MFNTSIWYSINAVLLLLLVVLGERIKKYQFLWLSLIATYGEVFIEVFKFAMS